MKVMKCPLNRIFFLSIIMNKILLKDKQILNLLVKEKRVVSK